MQLAEATIRIPERHGLECWLAPARGGSRAGCQEPGLSPDVVVECTGVAQLVRDSVLKNLVVFGSVNANHRRHYRAAQTLPKANRSCLEQLVTRRVGPDPLDRALAREPDDIKLVMEFAQA